jgi:hypothetical protein
MAGHTITTAMAIIMATLIIMAMIDAFLVPASTFNVMPFPLYRDGVFPMAPKKVLHRRWRMLDITKDIKRPAVLTVKGKAAAIVQDAEAYLRLLDIAARADSEEGIRQGLDDVAHGRTRPAKEVFDDIRRKHGISH